MTLLIYKDGMAIGIATGGNAEAEAAMKAGYVRTSTNVYQSIVGLRVEVMPDVRPSGG